MSKITIFTPAYNRAYTLEKLYLSIIKQKYKNFEWIIVDDGSVDNTKSLVKKWIKEKKIDIKYFYQENSGKHIAINKGVQEATGKYFFIVDSDDYLTDDALNIANKWIKTLKQKNIKYAGVAGRRVYEDGRPIGKSFKKKEYLDATTLERKKYNILGDKAEIFYTEVLKKYPFPKIDNENFLSEAYIWNTIARDGYKIRWFNEDLIVCEYRDDGLTKNMPSIADRNPKGNLLYLKDLINDDKNIIRKVAHYCSYCKIAQKIYSNKEIMEQLDINKFSLKMYLLISRVRENIKR